MNFKRIDEYHSVTYLGEEVYLSKIEDLGWKEIHRGPLITNEDFPYYCDGLRTNYYIDDTYTYVVTFSYCEDGHVAPLQIGHILRLDLDPKES